MYTYFLPPPLPTDKCLRLSTTVLVDYVKDPSHGASAVSLICIMYIYLAQPLMHRMGPAPIQCMNMSAILTIVH